MAIKAPNGNHVIIENVRVSYDDDTKTFHLTAKDPDLENGFHLTLNKGRKAEKQLRRAMEKAGYVFPDGIDRIPAFLSRHDQPADSPWNRVQLGKSETGNISWNTSLHPHAFIVGGIANDVRRSVISSLVNHCATNEDRWEIHGFDITATSFTTSDKQNFTRYSEYRGDAVKHLEDLQQEMQRRYALQDSAGAVRFDEIPDSPKHLMVILETGSQILDAPLYPSEYDKRSAEQQDSSFALVQELLAKGSKVGIHVVLAGGWFDRKFIETGILKSFSARFVLNQFPEWDSEMFLGNASAFYKAKRNISGRAIAQFDSKPVPFQIYSD
jgi:hypothetical protein